MAKHTFTLGLSIINTGEMTLENGNEMRVKRAK